MDLLSVVKTTNVAIYQFFHWPYLNGDLFDSPRISCASEIGWTMLSIIKHITMENVQAWQISALHSIIEIGFSSSSQVNLITNHSVISHMYEIAISDRHAWPVAHHKW